PIGRKLFAKRADALQRALTAAVSCNVKSALAGDMNFDLVAVFELQRLDNGTGKTNGKAVSPLRNPHVTPLISIYYVYHRPGRSQGGRKGRNRFQCGAAQQSMNSRRVTR